jgi:hypothetical protein
LNYSLLADLILLLHFGFVLFVIFGGLLGLLNIKWLWLHLPIFIWGAIVNLMYWVCPLTPLEIEYRIKAGEQGYQGGFIEHYIGNLIYPQGLGEHAGLILGVAALGWNAVVYFFVFYRRLKNIG